MVKLLSLPKLLPSNFSGYEEPAALSAGFFLSDILNKTSQTPCKNKTDALNVQRFQGKGALNAKL